jgi:hypothetical protein
LSEKLTSVSSIGIKNIAVDDAVRTLMMVVILNY